MALDSFRLFNAQDVNFRANRTGVFWIGRYTFAQWCFSSRDRQTLGSLQREHQL